MIKFVFFGIVIGVCLTAVARQGSAEPLTFSFDDPKGVNAVSLKLDSLLEPIVGFATGVSGTLTFDPESPSAMTGTVSIATESITMANKTMTEVLHSDEWLDVKKHPSVTYRITEVARAKRVTDTLYELTTRGTFALHGVSHDKEIPMTVSYQKERLPDRNHKGKGDLLIVRATFRVDRTKYGIKPAMGNDIVAKDIEIDVAVTGMAPAADTD